MKLEELLPAKEQQILRDLRELLGAQEVTKPEAK